MGYLQGHGGGPTIADFQTWLVRKYGGDLNVAFCSLVLRLALPDRESPRADNLSPEENGAAVDKLFELMIEWFEQTNDS
jgi:hypothetical protein